MPIYLVRLFAVSPPRYYPDHQVFLTTPAPKCFQRDNKDLLQIRIIWVTPHFFWKDLEMDSQPNVLKCNLWLSTIQIILHGTVAPPKFKLIWTRLENLQIAYCCGSWTLLPPWTLKSKALYLWLWTPDFVSRMTFESFKIVCFSNVLRWVQAYITVYLLKTYELFWSPATRPFIHLGSYGTHVIRL